MHIEVDKQKIYLNHYPFLCYGGAYRNMWQLFGHVHTSKNNTGKDASRLDMLFPTQYDVGVDNNDFTPVSFELVKEDNPKNRLNKQIKISNMRIQYMSDLHFEFRENSRYIKTKQISGNGRYTRIGRRHFLSERQSGSFGEFLEMGI